MFSIRKWLAAKVFAQATIGGGGSGNHQTSVGRRLLLEAAGTSRAANYESSTLHGSTLLRFYYADEELNTIAAELDSFDGRKDPARCSNLVNQLR